MKIAICGSMKFAKEMLEAKNRLEEMGHIANVPSDTLQMVSGELDHDDFDKDRKHCIENDIIREHFRLIENSDAVLVLNPNKNGIQGYIGGGTLMDIGQAHNMNKKIFVLNPLPSIDELSYVHEIMTMQPVILGGDLGAIPKDS